MEDGSTYYSPDEDFIGTGQVKYTVCVGSRCLPEVYRIHVEELPDWSNCENRLEAESVVTSKNKSIAIPIHANDVMCFGDNFPVSTSYASPIHGTYDMWQYSGNYKGTLYVYIPPTDFVGEDSFKYISGIMISLMIKSGSSSWTIMIPSSKNYLQAYPVYSTVIAIC